MGYYTNYEIVVDGRDCKDAELAPIIERLTEISNGCQFYRFEGHICSVDSYKWYGHPEDLATLSVEFPATLFELRAVGEDGERWQVFAKDGKTYTSNLTHEWPDVDEANFS